MRKVTGPGYCKIGFCNGLYKRYCQGLAVEEPYNEQTNILLGRFNEYCLGTIAG